MFNNKNVETMEGIDKGELIKLVTLAIASDPVEALTQFESLVKWVDKNATEEDRNKLIENAQAEIQNSGMVHIDRNDFISIYAHTQAVLGFEETRHRFPKLRLLVLNLMDEEELLSTMNLIRSIEERIKPGTDQ